MHESELKTYVEINITDLPNLLTDCDGALTTTNRACRLQIMALSGGSFTSKLVHKVLEVLRIAGEWAVHGVGVPVARGRVLHGADAWWVDALSVGMGMGRNRREGEPFYVAMELKSRTHFRKKEILLL